MLRIKIRDEHQYHDIKRRLDQGRALLTKPANTTDEQEQRKAVEHMCAMYEDALRTFEGHETNWRKHG